MIRPTYLQVCNQLDQLYFLPLAANETIETRALSIDEYLKNNGWSWDDLTLEMSKLDSEKGN